MAKPRIRLKSGGSRARSYSAATGSSEVARLTAMAGVGGVAGPEMIRRNLSPIVAASRAAARNADHAVALMLIERRHVIGPRGIRLQSAAVDAAGKADQAARDLVEGIWRDWGRIGETTVCGELGFMDLEDMAAAMTVRDGNILFRQYRGKEFGQFGYQVEPIMLDELAIDYCRPAEGGRNLIDGGIEFDGRGRRIAYHFRSPDLRRQMRVVPASEIIHVYTPLEPRQHFSLPSAHTGLHRLRGVEQFEDHVIAAADLGARVMAFLKRSADSDEAALTPGERSGTAGSGGGADDEGGGGRIDLPTEIEGSSIAELPPGYDVSSFSPTYPGTDIGGLVNHSLRGVAVGAGVSFGALTGNLENANYSTLRDGRGDERDEFRIRQRNLYRRMHERMFTGLMQAAFLSGRLNVSLAEFNRLLPHEWRPRGWQAISPKDEAIQNESDLGLNLIAPSDIAARRGEDFDEIVQRAAADLAKLIAAGLLPEGATLSDMAGNPVVAAAFAAPPGDDD